MACPYFFPVERLDDRTGTKPPHFPLGDACSGACRADPAILWLPEETVLKQLCNLGYARGKCPRFPQDGGPDAVRFMVSQDQNGLIQIYYVLEKDHHPFQHGPLEYSGEARGFATPHPNELVHRQAQAYVESYLRRKRGPGCR